MKEAVVHPLPEISVEIHDVPIPSPSPDQVVIKVEVAGSNVKGTPFSRLIAKLRQD
jgi:NADPH2:quinone reductase